jgi:2-methylfumaryl-CoA hydratase
MALHTIDGPFFEDFYNGQIFGAPAVTVTEGFCSIYQSIIGDRMRLSLDHELTKKVTGSDNGLVHPMLVINIVNGQTTYASQNVKGNLFYRGLIMKSPVFINDTLTTTTKVVGLNQNKNKPGRNATGMVALEIETLNQNNECVMRYWRCPMIPCRDPSAETGHIDDFSEIPKSLTEEAILESVPSAWNIEPLISSSFDSSPPQLDEGDRIIIAGQDTITAAPELVRLTGNIAFAHTDASKSYLKKRLVYGGQTISLAHAQIMRAMPDAITMIGWQGCDHLGPVLEEDIIRSELEVVRITPAPSGGTLNELRVETFAKRLNQDNEYEETEVLDWRLIIWSN